MRLVLASQSASRRAMLDTAGVPYEAVAAMGRRASTRNHCWRAAHRRAILPTLWPS